MATRPRIVTGSIASVRCGTPGVADGRKTIRTGGTLPGLHESVRPRDGLVLLRYHGSFRLLDLRCVITRDRSSQPDRLQ